MARGCAGEVLSSEINPLVCRPCAVKGKTIRGAAVCELCTDTTESETLCMASPAEGMRKSSMRGNRESSGSDWGESQAQSGRGRSEIGYPTRTLPSSRTGS